jgi:VIT1/CCC1 family predicted Fe2+/Mn2+ transporter
MDDRRRARVPWYLWRWRVGLIAPMVLFWVMAVSGMREFRDHPVWSVVWGVGFLGLAGVFARLLWRERRR